MSHDLVVFDVLDEKMSQRVNNFREHTSDMSGKIRSQKEIEVHNDKYCSDDDIKKWVIIFEDKEVVATTAIFQRSIMVSGEDIVLGGIGRVRVREDRRKMGLASRMMIVSMEEMKELHSDIAYLCTDTQSFLVVFYERYGFVKMKQSYAFLSKSGIKYVENDGMLAPINSKDIFTKIMNDKNPLDIGVGNW